jgi:hypothetical protein
MAGINLFGKQDKKPSEIDEMKISMNNLMTMQRNLNDKVDQIASKSTDGNNQKEILDALSRHSQYIEQLHQRLSVLESGKPGAQKESNPNELNYETAFKKLVEVIIDLDQQMKPKPAKEKGKAKVEA